MRSTDFQDLGASRLKDKTIMSGSFCSDLRAISTVKQKKRHECEEFVKIGASFSKPGLQQVEGC